MKIKFQEPDNGISISSVKIIWNNDVLHTIPLTKMILTNEWVTEIENLTPGNYEYRFLINDDFTLNDPLANMYNPDRNNMLWSLLVIDKDGRQLFNNEQYTVHIESIQMNNDFYDDIREMQTEFSTDTSKQVVIRYEFTQVTGAHTVSVLWVSPTQKIAGWSEETMINPSEFLWFCLDFSSLSDISSGVWSVLLFIDGEFILKNDFNVKYIPVAPHSFNLSV